MKNNRFYNDRQRHGGLRPGLCLSCTKGAWPQSASYALSGFFYQLNWPCRPAIFPGLVRAATPIVPGLFSSPSL